MYDSLRLWLPSTDTTDTGQVFSVLSDPKERVDPHTGDLWQCGRLGNLKVQINGAGVKIDGSLSAFHLGSNAETLTRRTTQEAIERLSDTLHLPVGEAKVGRLDVAQNLIMRAPVGEYLACLESAPYCKRSDVADRETVYFQSAQKCLAFYDKARQLTRAKAKVPDVFTGRNVLRFEARFLKRIGRQFDKKELRAAELYVDSFYVQVHKRYGQEYSLIQKVRRKVALQMQDGRKLIDSIAAWHLQEPGELDRVIDLVRSSKEKGDIDKVQCWRHIQKLKALACAKVGDVDDRIDELDSKVRAAVACCR